jgi:hypothetical protein
MAKIPTGAALQRYSVNRRGQVEAVRQTFYDFQTYAQAGQSQLNFFALPIGQGTTSHPGSTGPKTKADTNMTTAGSLPSPQRFLVKSIEIMFLPGLTVGQFNAVASDLINFSDDVYNVSKSGYLDFVIGSKSYLTEAPIGRFPPKTRLETGHAALASNSATTGALMIDYAAFGGRPYLLDAPLYLESTQNFSVSLNWPNAVALAAADTTARIGIILDGYLYRLSQ